MATGLLKAASAVVGALASAAGKAGGSTSTKNSGSTSTKSGGSTDTKTRAEQALAEKKAQNQSANSNSNSTAESGSGKIGSSGGSSGSSGGSSSGAQGTAKSYTGTSDAGKGYTIGSQKGVDFIENAAVGTVMTGGDGSTWVKNADGTTSITKNGEHYVVDTRTKSGGNTLPQVTQQQVTPTQSTGVKSTPSANGLSYAQLLPSAQQGGAGSGTYTGIMQATTPDGQTINVSYENGQRVTEIPNGTIVHTQGGDFIWNAALGKSVPVDDSETVAGAQGLTMYTNDNGERVEGVYEDDGSRYQLNEYDRQYLTAQEQAIAAQLKRDWWAANAAGDTEGMKRANEQLDQIRRTHGYTLGKDGATFEMVEPTMPETFVPETLQTPVIENPWEEYIDEYIPSYQEQANALNQQRLDLAMQQAELNYGQQKETVNQSYDDLARQLYIQRRQAERNMPQQLAAMGYNGGLTESSMLGLQTSYQDSLRQAEQERIATINSLDTAITQAKLSGNIELVNQLQTVADNVMNMYTQALGNIQSINTAQAQLNYNAASDNVANKLAAYNYSMAQRQLAEEKAQTARNQLISSGTGKLDKGILPSAAELEAMGLSLEDAQAYITRLLTAENLDNQLTQAQTYKYYT